MKFHKHNINICICFRKYGQLDNTYCKSPNPDKNDNGFINIPKLL